MTTNLQYNPQTNVFGLFENIEYEIIQLLNVASKLESQIVYTGYIYPISETLN